MITIATKRFSSLIFNISRVEQATNLCRSHEACRFGYTFTDSETDLMTSESKISEEESQEAVKTLRRRPGINIDPRRKTQNNRGVSVIRVIRHEKN